MKSKISCGTFAGCLFDLIGTFDSRFLLHRIVITWSALCDLDLCPTYCKHTHIIHIHFPRLLMCWVFRLSSSFFVSDLHRWYRTYHHSFHPKFILFFFIYTRGLIYTLFHHKQFQSLFSYVNENVVVRILVVHLYLYRCMYLIAYLLLPVKKISNRLLERDGMDVRHLVSVTLHWVWIMNQ